MAHPTAYLWSIVTALTVLLLLVFRGVLRVAQKEDHLSELLDKGSPARALLHVGDVLAIFMISGSVVAETVHGEDPKHDMLWALVFGVVATLLFAIASRLGMRLLVRSRLHDELERGNTAAGLAAASHSLATGIITARAIAGDDLASLGQSAVFFVASLVSLHILVMLFRLLTSYDDADEILGENLAAALSYAGLTIAAGIIVGHAVEGPFAGWLASFEGFGLALVYGVALYVVRQLVVQTVLLGARPTLRGGKLDDEIGRHRNVAMGALEAIAYVGAALLVERVG